MAADKTIPRAAAKATSVCGSCETEFSGSVCPECGNKKGNKKLAPDGIEQQLHKPDFLLGFDGDPLSDEYLLSLQSAKMATEEFKENMRQAQVNLSESKRLDSEKKLISKRREVERLSDGWDDTYPPVENTSGSVDQFPQQPLFGAQSPQAQFMSQLMKMDGEKRAEFMAQLSDADPSALNTLSGMFVQPQGQTGQMPGNPGQFPGMYPPWMMQQPPQAQHEPQQQESTTTVMREMFSLMKEMQPARDDSAIEVIRELKDEIKGLHSRMDSVGRESQGQGGNDALIQYVQNLEKKIESARQMPTFSEQAKELKETIQNLESIGLMNNNTGTSSIEDRIRMKEIDHQIDMETKQFQVDRDTADVEQNKQRSREAFTKSLFTNILSPGPKEEPAPVPADNVAATNPFFNLQSPKVLTKPKVIVDTIQSDEGTVCEVRDRPEEQARSE